MQLNFDDIVFSHKYDMNIQLKTLVKSFMNYLIEKWIIFIGELLNGLYSN